MSTTELEKNAIGLREVAFQSICSMAPAAAIAASIPFGSPFAGGALPLAVIFAFVGIFFTANSIGQLAKHLPSSGSVGTYAAVALRPEVGFLMGWIYAAVEVMIVPLVMLQLGYTVAGEWNSKQHGFSTGNWWIFTVLGTLLVCFLVWRGIRTSAKTSTWLGFIEIIIFSVLGIVLIIKAGGHNTLAVFGVHYANAPGFHGWSGVIAGSVYTLLAFSGFEAAAPMAEETKDARRNVPRAIMIATVCIGVLYAFTTYAADVAFGPSKFAGFAASANGVPWDGLANTVSIVFWLLVLVAIINSTIANAIAGSNVFTRTSYAFARAGVFPKALAKLNGRFKSPQNAIVLQLILGLLIALGLGAWKGATTAFGIVATGLTVGVVVVYLVTNVACFAYFARHRREERHPILHILFPIIAIVFLTPAVINGTGITGVPGLKWVAPLPAPLSYGAWAIGAWVVVGIVTLFVLRSNKREAINEVATLHE